MVKVRVRPHKGGRSAPATQTTTQKMEPPDFIQPFLEPAAQEASRLFEAGPRTFFPGSTVVGFNPETEAAFNLATQRALNPNTATMAGEEALRATAAGEFIGSNPFLDDTIDIASRGVVRNFQEAIAPGIAGQFAGSGRIGSGAESHQNLLSQEMLARQLGDISTQMASEDLARERQAQLGAAAIAPQSQAAILQNFESLRGVGAEREAMGAANLQEQIDRHLFEQMAEGENLNELIARLTALGGFGGTVSGTQLGTQARQGGGGILGGISGAGAGLGLGSMFAPAGATGMAALGGPLGIGLGILGGIGGLF